VRLRSTRLLWSSALVLLLIAYLRWLSPAVSPYAGGSDSSGYLWSARLFRQGRLSMPIRLPERFPIDATGAPVFAPLGGTIRRGTMDLVPTYPTGLPLHIAVANLFLDEERAVKGVLLFAAAGAIWLLYLLGRDAGLPRLWAAGGGALLALSPLFLYAAVQPFSDVMATFWAEAAVLSAWRSRQRPALVWLAGVSLGIATLVRPMSLVLILPVLAAMTLSAGFCVRLATGGLPFAVFVLAYQAWAYGSPLRSGYDRVWSAFGWHAVLQSLSHYVTWCPRLASWLVVLVPAAAWTWQGRYSRWRLVGAAWIVATFGTYAFYALTSETWWYMRYVLPGFPVLIIAGLAGLRAVALAAASWIGRPWAGRTIGLAAFAVLLLSAGLLARDPLSAAYRATKAGERVYPDTIRIISADKGSSEVVLMSQLSGAANYYAPGMPFLRYDALKSESWLAVRRWQRDEQAVIKAALFGFETDRMFGMTGPLLPCNWHPRGHYRNVTFWECPPPGRE
jgi:hypothetical protein